ncbi:MAG: hypothetical protein ACR2JH_05890 [Solirubrobacteraceae bacterium]
MSSSRCCSGDHHRPRSPVPLRDRAQSTIIGAVLVLTGLGFLALELSGHGHSHSHERGHSHSHGHDHDHDHEPGPHSPAQSRARGLIVFSAVTIGTIVTLTLVACFGGYQSQAQWLDRWGNAFTALVLLVIGALVLTGII